MIPRDMPFYTTLVVILAGMVFLLGRKTSRFAREGLDPGLLGIKIWPARIHFLIKGHSIVQSAYKKAKDKPYLLQTLVHDRLVLPPKYLPELRMLPGTKLNASEALVESILGRYSGVDTILKDRQSNDITRIQLTKSLPVIVPLLAVQINSILEDKLRSCTHDSFIPMKIQDLISHMILRTTLFVFVGAEDSKNEELQLAMQEHARLVRDTAILLLLVPKFLRPLVHPFLPCTQGLKRLHQKVQRILFRDQRSRPNGSTMPTMLEHYVATAKVVDEREITAKFLVLVSAALHTMTMATVQALIDMCAYPQHINTLRREATKSIDDNVTLEQIQDLRYLDSFLKESQRTNPPNYLGFNRIARDEIQLSDGLTIPKGQFICMPAAPMAMDEDFYSAPSEFDPLRFMKHGQRVKIKDDECEGFSFVEMEDGNVHWGNGRYTCPGRFYASVAMKMIVACIIRNYDLRFPEGNVGRLPNIYLDIIVEPNPKQLVHFRRRR